VPRDGTAALRRGEKPFPSEQRLAEIDVHTAGLPKALLLHHGLGLGLGLGSPYPYPYPYPYS